MDTSIELEFGDGKYRFWLNMPAILDIEKGEKSIMQMWADMSAALVMDESNTPVFLGGGPARLSDVRDVIRAGLIAGGEGSVDGQTVNVGPMDANRLIERYVMNRPIAEVLPVAWAVLHAAIMGVRLKKKADEPVKKPARSRKGKSSPTAAS